MTEPHVLIIRDDRSVEFYGRKFDLLSFTSESVFHNSVYDWARGSVPETGLRIVLREQQPEPLPVKKKRTWASVMGLRKPK